MPVHTNDRLLWIVVGTGLLVVANAIPYYLNYIRALTTSTIDQEEAESRGTREDAADALKLSTLEKLAAGPSFKLRSAAVRIIADRSTRTATRKLLLRDLASKNPGKREQALHALWFLLSDTAIRDSSEVTQEFSDPATFSAIVECLVNLLPLHQTGPAICANNPTASSPLLPRNRPWSETRTLRILGSLLTNQTTALALSAGLVSKWLKHYPFPCALDENSGRRQQVVELFNTYRAQDDELMASIIKMITSHPEGRKQLRRHDLTGSSVSEALLDSRTTEDVLMTDSEDTAGLPSASSSGPLNNASRRPLRPSSDQAERAVRQRRREAAVYSEGDAPLTQDNIFQRQPSNTGPPPATSPETEAELAREEEELVEALEEVRERTTRTAPGPRNLDPPNSFWQWLTWNSGRVSAGQRDPAGGGGGERSDSSSRD